MAHRTSLVYRKTAILNESYITVSEHIIDEINRETRINFFNPIEIGDKVMPCKPVIPSDYQLPIVKKDDSSSPEGIYTFGIVVSKPRIIREPEKSISRWDEIFKNQYYRVAVIDFYNFEWDI